MIYFFKVFKKCLFSSLLLYPFNTMSTQANVKASAQQQGNNSNAGRNAKKKKKNKRAAKRKKFVEKLIHKSI